MRAVRLPRQFCLTCCRTWYPKVLLAAMRTWASAAGTTSSLGISARSHRDAATLRRALERMDAAWPEGEEHMAKLSVNAMIGLWARTTEVVHCAAAGNFLLLLGLGAQTADHWVRRYVRGGSAQKLDWLVVEEITQLDMALWADLACVGLNADVCRPCWTPGPGDSSARRWSIAHPRPGRRAQARAYGERPTPASSTL